jgi:protoporphyrinogen oxidase
MHYLIIGSGLSGLSVGASLLKAGHRVTLLEKEDAVGGLARSFKKDGFLFDIGPHIFFGKKMVARLLDLVGADVDLVLNDRLKEAIYFDRRLFKYPFQPKDLLLKMGKGRLLKALWELSVRNLWRNRRLDEYDNLYDWTTSKVGPTLFYYTGLDGYIEKLYGIPSDKISSDWGKQRLKPLLGFRLWRSVLKGAIPSKKQHKAYTHYCPEGIGEIADSLARYVNQNGGIIRLNTAVEEVQLQGDAITNVTLKRSNGISAMTGDYVISTVRIVDLVQMLSPAPPKAVISAANALRYRNLILLYLIINRPIILTSCLVYIAERTTTFKRLSEFKHFTDNAAPEGKTSLCVEICCNPDDDIWKEKDDIIFQKSMAELQELDIVAPQDVEAYFVQRIPSSYPIYYLSYRHTLTGIFEYLAGIRNLVSIGRQGLYQHDNMSVAIRSGFELADRLGQSNSKNIHEVSQEVYRDRLNKYAKVM